MKPGDRVLHRVFGQGIIVDVERVDLLIVKFDQFGKKRVDISYLQLLNKHEEELMQASDEKFYCDTFAKADKDDDHVHGNHFGSVGLNSGEVVRDLPSIVNASQVFPSARPNNAGYRLPTFEPTGSALIWPVNRHGLVSIIRHAGAGEKSHEFIAVYPWVSEGKQHSAVLNKVYPWSSRLEGQIECSIDDVSITFFDAGYTANRKFYRINEYYEFIFTGFAYSCEVKKNPAPIILTDHNTIEKYRKVLNRKDDDYSPIVFETKGLALFLPIQKYDRDEYEYNGTVSRVEKYDFLSQPLWRLRVVVARSLSADRDIELDIYVHEDKLEGRCPPDVGDDVHGTLWLQGYLWS